MFNTLYRCPRTIARHENGPLAESRRRLPGTPCCSGSSDPHNQSRRWSYLSRHNPDEVVPVAGESVNLLGLHKEPA